MNCASTANRLKNQAKRKIGLFDNAKQLVEKVLPVTDLDRFSEGFRAYLFDELKKRSQGSMDTLSYEKVIMLYDYDKLDQHLRNLEIEYKKLNAVKLDETYTKMLPVDTGIYAETEQELKRLKEYETIEKFVKGMEKEGVKVNYSHLSRAFYPVTAINISELSPNVNYIKGYNTH